MEQLLKVFWQTLWQITGKIITSFSTLLILGFVSRSYGSEGVGFLTLALTYLGFFSLVTDLGLNGYLLPKFLEPDYEKTWRKLFGLRLILAIGSIILAYAAVLVWHLNPVFKELVMVGALIAILEQAVFTSCTIILQSKLRYDLAITATSIGYLVVLLGAVWGNLNHLGLPYFMFSYALGWLVIFFISLWFCGKFIKNITPIFDYKFLKDIFKSAWPISATLVLNLLYFRLDSFLISIFRNFSEVGIYNLSYQIFQAALVLPTFIMNGYYPLMVENMKSDKKKFIKNLELAILAMLVIGAVGLVLTLVLAPIAIKVVGGGKAFADSVTLLRILSVGFPFFFISALLMWVLVTIKDYQALIIIYAAGLIINAALNLFFIPSLTYWAAAWITVVSEGVILLLQSIYLAGKLWK